MVADNDIGFLDFFKKVPDHRMDRRKRHLEEVRLLFDKKPEKMSFVTGVETDKGHGRLESRQCTVTTDIQWLKERHPNWKELNSVIEIESIREVKGAVSIEKRYYISSLITNVTEIAHAVRQHWGVENKLHWVLDICFNDDQCRIRKGNAPRNVAIIRKTVLNLLYALKKTNPRISLKRMRKLAGWDYDFLDCALRAQF